MPAAIKVPLWKISIAVTDFKAARRVYQRSNSALLRASSSPQKGAPSRDDNATATAANATGKDQAQSPNMETALAAIRQPTRKPMRSCRDLFNRPLSTDIIGRFDNLSISDKTELLKLPVITAVEIAPGMAKRSSAY